ncbi:MAG: hypothetical protein FD165_195 [Gammaproteobacteria bacterium]|nr:MAG: hypothetical protein FD165_195 [Gammaproteobacteria bacterium]TND06773.1 MAG: hypothetical protein FD120_505 [Gammaproteobacteria bacterium]
MTGDEYNGTPRVSLYNVDKLIDETRRLAVEYRKATGKTLGGVSGEIANYDAARILDLELAGQNVGGYDAIGKSGARQGQRIQIKGRAILEEGKSGQRIGQLKTGQDWDLVVLVLMDESLEPVEMYEAEREELENALEQSGGGKKNKRGAMSVAKFKIVSHLVWSRDQGLIESEVWDNQAAP